MGRTVLSGVILNRADVYRSRDLRAVQVSEDNVTKFPRGAERVLKEALLECGYRRDCVVMMIEEDGRLVVIRNVDMTQEMLCRFAVKLNAVASREA